MFTTCLLPYILSLKGNCGKANYPFQKHDICLQTNIQNPCQLIFNKYLHTAPALSRFAAFFKLRLGAFILRSVGRLVGLSVLQKLQKYDKSLQNISNQLKH